MTYSPGLRSVRLAFADTRCDCRGAELEDLQSMPLDLQYAPSGVSVQESDVTRTDSGVRRTWWGVGNYTRCLSSPASIAGPGLSAALLSWDAEFTPYLEVWFAPHIAAVSHQS
jgi:hypothetical protein